MASKQKNVQSKADQPRVSTQSLKRMDAPANLQYKVTGIRSFNSRKPKRTDRNMAR